MNVADMSLEELAGFIREVTHDPRVDSLLETIGSGAGTPEGVITAPPGVMWLRTDGGAGTTQYVKETGTGNTGWVAK